MYIQYTLKYIYTLIFSSCSWDVYNFKPVIPSIKLKVLQENLHFTAQLIQNTQNLKNVMAFITVCTEHDFVVRMPLILTKFFPFLWSYSLC